MLRGLILAPLFMMSYTKVFSLNSLFVQIWDRTEKKICEKGLEWKKIYPSFTKKTWLGCSIKGDRGCTLFTLLIELSACRDTNSVSEAFRLALVQNSKYEEIQTSSCLMEGQKDQPYLAGFLGFLKGILIKAIMQFYYWGGSICCQNHSYHFRVPCYSNGLQLRTLHYFKIRT